MPKPVPIESAFIDVDGDDVLQLIVDYRRAVRVGIDALRATSAIDGDLIAGWRGGLVPRVGRLSSPSGRYTFHGVGCRFEIARRVVDVEFGPNGRHDGFDAWRLAAYAESAFEWHALTAVSIERGLHALERGGVVYRPVWDPSPHLYYLQSPLRLAQ